MNWPGLQGRAPIMRALFRLPRGERSDLSRDGDNSGLEENQEVEAHLINNVGQTGEGALGHQQHVNRRNTNSSGGVEETERERIRRGSSTWRNDLEEGGGGLEARSRESSDAGRTHILGRNSGGSTGQLGIDENGDEHLNVTIDPVEFLKDVFTCLLLLSANIFVRHYMEIIHLGSAIFLLYLVDRKLRGRVAQPTSVSPVTCIAMAVLSVLYALSSMHIVGKTVGLKQVWRRYLFLPLHDVEKTENVQPKGLGETIWLACMLDCWAKHVIFAMKALVAAAPFVPPYREFRNETTTLSQKRKLYAIIEAIGRCYRTLLPCPGWLDYYSPIADFSRGKRAIASHLSVFSVVYLIIKCANFVFRCKSVLDGICIHCNGMAEFGRLATDDDLRTTSECCICHEIVKKPAIVLECSHIFCEDCLQEWLDRESTCPLCRRRTRSQTPIPISYRNGHTSLLPFFW